MSHYLHNIENVRPVIGRDSQHQRTQVIIGNRRRSEVLDRATSEGEAGTWNDNFGESPADILRVAGGVVTDFKRG